MKQRKIIYALTLSLTLFTLLSPVKTFAQNISNEAEATKTALSDNIKVDSRLRELFFGKSDNTNQSLTLIPGGCVFGIKCKQSHVTVTESASIPALSAGDIIIAINGNPVCSVDDVRAAVEGSGGSSVTIKALHHGEEIAIEARPSLVDGVYRLGLGLRDTASGIGTVTYCDPKTGAFGGLGHGICDSESGEVIPIDTGKVTGVILGGVHKGECGKPGELSGILKENDLGTISKNTDCGVFGVLTDTSILPGTSALPVGTRNDVREGEATIISSLKNGKSSEYKIEIYDIDKESEGSKSFRIRTTDPALLAISGGIVRGMSGSPIIQDGKLIGAVTHVLVANPTEGYGISIENMLSSAENKVQPKAA